MHEMYEWLSCMLQRLNVWNAYVISVYQYHNVYHYTCVLMVVVVAVVDGDWPNPVVLSRHVLCSCVMIGLAAVEGGSGRCYVGFNRATAAVSETASARW